MVEAIAQAPAELAAVEEAPIELTTAEPEIISTEEPPAAVLETPSEMPAQHEPGPATMDQTPSASAPPELLESPVVPAFSATDEEIVADDAQLFATAPDGEAMEQVPPDTATVALALPATAAADARPMADAPAPAPPRVAPVTITRPAPRQAPNDPLMAVHALSDEEISRSSADPYADTAGRMPSCRAPV